MDKDSAMDETAQAVGSVGSVIGDEVGKFIKSMVGQATGSSTSDSGANSAASQNNGAKGYEKLAQSDDEFKKKAEAEWFQKYNAIYANAASRAKQEKERLAKKHEEQEEEQKKLEELNETRVRQNFTNRALEQTKAENKNYGAE